MGVTQIIELIKREHAVMREMIAALHWERESITEGVDEQALTRAVQEKLRCVDQLQYLSEARVNASRELGFVDFNAVVDAHIDVKIAWDEYVADIVEARELGEKNRTIIEGLALENERALANIRQLTNPEGPVTYGTKGALKQRTKSNIELRG